MELQHFIIVPVMLILYLTGADCIPVGQFFPHGDEVLLLPDDGSSGNISLSMPYPVLGRQWTSLWVNSNGVISLNQPFRYYSLRFFPNIHNGVILCPFWIDLDPRRGGTISHNRSTFDRSIAIRVEQLIQQSFGYSFTPTGVFITTWERISLFGSQELTNTFQCVLATNGLNTFVLFLYADEAITGRGALIGIDGNDEANYFIVPESQGTYPSNVDQPGLWIFKADGHIIGGPPDSFTDVLVIDVGTTEATLGWTHGVNNSPDSFRITCLPPVAFRLTVSNTNVTAQNYVNFTYSLTGLNEYTNYTCFITARNIFGDGPLSDPINIATDPTAPSGPPLNVTGEVLSPTSLVFEWSPPSEEERNGPLTGYSVVLEWEEGQEHRVDTADTNYTFTELQQGTTYNCSIAAHTSVGTGPYYNIIIATPAVTTETSETPITSAHASEDISTLTESNEIMNFGLIGGVSGGAAFLVVVAIIIIMLVIICTKRLHIKKTATRTEIEMDDHCHVYEKVAANTTVLNAYLEEPDEQEKDGHYISRVGTADQEKKQTHSPALKNSSEVRGTAHRKKHPMLPPTAAKNVPTLPTTTNSDGIYMSLSSNRRREEQQSQYMSLSAATRKTQSNVGVSAWRRAQESKDTQSRWRAQREIPEEPVYMNQAKCSKHKDHVIEEPFA